MPNITAAFIVLMASYPAYGSMAEARNFVEKHGTQINSANTELKTVMSEARSGGVVTRKFMSIVLSGEYAASVLLVEEKWTHNFSRVEQVSFLLSPRGQIMDRCHRIIRYSNGLAQVDDLAFPLDQANKTVEGAVSFWASGPSLATIRPGAWASTRR